MSLSSKIKELRFVFCQSSPASQAVRNFIKSEYKTIKAKNPYLPILVREKQNASPVMVARYDMGEERLYKLSGQSEEEIAKHLKQISPNY